MMFFLPISRHNVRGQYPEVLYFEIHACVENFTTEVVGIRLAGKQSFSLLVGKRLNFFEESFFNGLI